MDGLCLVVDFRQQDQVSLKSGSHEDCEMKILVASPAQALLEITTRPIVALFGIADSWSEDIERVLRKYASVNGVLPAFQKFALGKASPILTMQLFEFGVDQVCSSESWEKALSEFLNDCVEILSADESVEAVALQLARSIHETDQKLIKQLATKLKEEAEYDLVAAYSRGKALEATGYFGEAVKVFRNTLNINRAFRPAQSSLAENLLVVGEIDEAVKILKDAEDANPYYVGRKATLAIAFAEQGDLKMALHLVNEAEKLSSSHSALREAQAYLKISDGRYEEAFELMDEIENAGPIFVAKLNEKGIELSQAGKGHDAVALYDRAHSIVRPELRYKLTLNAAIACHRVGKHQKSLTYLDRCEEEYGSSFEKLERIRKIVTKFIKKSAGAA